MERILELWRDIEGEETIRLHIDPESIGLATALGRLVLSHGDFARVAAEIESYHRAVAAAEARLSLK